MNIYFIINLIIKKLSLQYMDIQNQKAVFSFGDLTKDASFTKFQNIMKIQNANKLKNQQQRTSYSRYTPTKTLNAPKNYPQKIPLRINNQLDESLKRTRNGQQNKFYYAPSQRTYRNQTPKTTKEENLRNTSKYQKNFTAENILTQNASYQYNPTIQDIQKKYGINKTKNMKKYVNNQQLNTPSYRQTKIDQTYKQKRNLMDILCEKTKMTQQFKQTKSKPNINKLNLKIPELNKINERMTNFTKLEQLSPNLVQSSQRGALIQQKIITKPIINNLVVQQSIKAEENEKTKEKINSINQLNQKINNKLKNILKNRRLY